MVAPAQSDPRPVALVETSRVLAGITAEIFHPPRA
jgi:hypothetical protein